MALTSFGIRKGAHSETYTTQDAPRATRCARVLGLGPDTTGVDADGDGWTVEGGDCDDADPSVHPGAYDVPADDIDQDCDGFDACVADASYPEYVGIDRDGK
ncbi:MAG TPA: putative metal-binding motif-containing protein, partial [Nocardioides sp.]|nr:putative metal-binding motif-containing protein [Nocardioides sp.]